MLVIYFKLAVLIGLVACSQQSLMDVMNMKCPEIKSMPNLDFKKLSGVWYTVSMDEVSYPPGLSCFKTTFINDGAKITEYEETYNINTMSYTNVTSQLQVDVARDSVILLDKYPYTDMLGKTVMRPTRFETFHVDTDYNTYVFGLGCVERINFWDPKPHIYYFMNVRDRSFDSLKTLNSIFQRLKYDIDFNQMVFPYQGPNCKN